MIDYIQRTAVKPKLFISGSAIGWYGIELENNPITFDEDCENNSFFLGEEYADFSQKLCMVWENLALSVASLLPVAIVRTGVVIDPNGGMMSRLITPFKLGLGGKLGTGQQVMSWISREDWARAVMFIIEKNVSKNRETTQKPQIYNLTAPTPITNLTFTKTLGKWLHRPTLFTLPRFLLKLILGEMATLLIDGQKVVPKHLLDSGFKFKHLTLIEALQKP